MKSWVSKSEEKIDFIKGDKVIDLQGDIGIIDQIDDIHNIWVKLENGNDMGVYCLEKDCDCYHPLNKVNDKNN